jgi:hypothetical protein
MYACTFMHKQYLASIYSLRQLFIGFKSEETRVSGGGGEY